MTLVFAWTCVYFLVSLTIFSLVGCGGGGSGGDLCTVSYDCGSGVQWRTLDGVGSDSKCCSSVKAQFNICFNTTEMKPLVCAVVHDCSGLSLYGYDLPVADWRYHCTDTVYCNVIFCNESMGTFPVLPSTPCCSSFNAFVNATAKCDGKSPDNATMKALACDALQDCEIDSITEGAVKDMASRYVTGLDQCSGSAAEETVKAVAEDPSQKAVVATSQAENTDVAFAKVV